MRILKQSTRELYHGDKSSNDEIEYFSRRLLGEDGLRSTTTPTRSRQFIAGRQKAQPADVLGLLSQEGEHNGPFPLLEPLDPLLERTQLNPVELLQGISKLDPGLLYGPE